MKTTMRKGLSGERLKNVLEEFRAGTAFREQLVLVIKQKIDSNKREVLSKSSYESPAWPFLQADANGYARGLLEVISLITEKDVE